MNALYYGKNLQGLRDSIVTESVDLIYHNPPFNSNATYNVDLLGVGCRDRRRSRSNAYARESTRIKF